MYLFSAEIISLDFFPPNLCFNTIECVFLKKVPSSCALKSITLTDREHQKFFSIAVHLSVIEDVYKCYKE